MNKQTLSIILFFYFLSFCHGTAEIAIQDSDLTKARCFTAIVSMSGDQKTIWWHFLPYLNADTDNAFIAYMISNFTFNSTGACDLEAEVNGKSRLLATQDAGIAEHRSVEKIASLGTMEINMWALGYACLDATCDKFTPVVLRDVGKNRTAFFSLWERHELEDSGSPRIRNSFTARVLELPTEVIKPDNNEIGLRVLKRSSKTPELCVGLSMQDDTRSNTTILLNSTRFDSSKLDVKVAAEAAGFSLTGESDGFCNRRRNKGPLCLMGIETDQDSPSELLNVTSSQVQILLSFMSYVKNSYIQSQNSVLQLKNPGTDVLVAAIALPSSVIAVLIAAVPFINFQLRVFRRMIMKTSQWLRVFILCIFNMILCGVSYSTALTLVPSELQRQRSFKTWALVADQIPINRRLQVLVVVQGKSTYRSPSLLLVLVSLGVLLPAVAFVTVCRCKHVFWRMKLLQELQEMESEYTGVEEESEEKTRVIHLRAIEMTKVEERLLVSKLARVKSLRRRASLKVPPLRPVLSRSRSNM